MPLRVKAALPVGEESQHLGGVDPQHLAQRNRPPKDIGDPLDALEVEHRDAQRRAEPAW